MCIRDSLDSLELANGDFGYPITEKEVRKVNRMLELMENVRSRQMCPTEGDKLSELSWFILVSFILLLDPLFFIRAGSPVNIRSDLD